MSGVPGKRRCGSRLGDVQQAGRRDGGDECARDSMHPSQDDASCSPCAGTCQPVVRDEEGCNADLPDHSRICPQDAQGRPGAGSTCIRPLAALVGAGQQTVPSMT
ncbi:hypothetical protein ACFPRL_23960 [Pseudoclavibacter helvolus]